MSGNDAVIASEGLDIKLTLEPLKNYLEEKAQGSRNFKSTFIEFVLEEFRKHSDLSDGLTLPKLMERRELLDMIYAALSVSVEDEKDHLWALCSPITPLIFYGTDAIYSLLLDEKTGLVKNNILETHIDIAQNKTHPRHKRWARCLSLGSAW